MTPLRRSMLGRDPGEHIAAVPALLGFTPTDSVVLITYTGTTTLIVHNVLRLDAPAPRQVGDLARHLRVMMATQDATVTEVVMLGGATDETTDLPYRHFIDEVTTVFDDAGILITHTVWAPRIEHGLTWRCYEDPDCTGQIGDPATSPAADAAKAAGAVTYASRAELTAQLAADPAAVLARRADLLHAQPAVSPERDILLIGDTVDSISDAGSAEVVLNDDTIVGLAHALSHPDVRQACLEFPLTARAQPAERLWTLLTRATPAPAVAHPASLLAVSLYLRGDGTLAGVALDTALAADPDHLLAQTIRTALNYGLPPTTFRRMLEQAFVDARTADATPAGSPDTDHSDDTSRPAD